MFGHRFLAFAGMNDNPIAPQGPAVMPSEQDSRAPQDENPAAATQNPGGPPQKLPKYTAAGKSDKNKKPIPPKKK
jgi:hypothetical protein